MDLADLDALEAKAVAEREKHTPMKERSTPEWAFHTLGAIQEMRSRGVSFGGVSLLLTSNVPHGAGTPGGP